MGRTCRVHVEIRNAYTIFIGKPEGKISIGGTRCRREGNIRKGLSEIGLGLWTEIIWLRTGTSDGFCEHRNEL
jgi:hypothetical protein